MNHRPRAALALLAALAVPDLARAQEDDLELPAARPARPRRPSTPAAPTPAPAPAPAPVPAAPVEPAPAAVTAPPDATAALRDELAALRTRLAALEARPSPPAVVTPPPAPPAPPAPPRAPTDEPWIRLAPPRFDGNRLLDPVGVVVSGYAQVQLEGSQLSEDQLQQGGLPLNRDRFVVRRGRLRVDGSWRWSTFALEIDGSTTRGPFFGLRRAEASFVWRNPARGAPPWVQVTAGLTEIPFGFELPDGVRRRVFMERSLASLAFFRAEPDIGLRVSGGVGWFRYNVAVMGGSPLDDRAGGPAFDPVGAKDVAGRVGFDVGRADAWQITGGVSFLAGTGLHAGSDATNNGVIWRDLNENATLDAGELTAVPGRAAIPSVTYNYWGANLDLGVRVRSRLGWTHVYGELSLASNLDRGVFPSDPIANGGDVRQLGFYVGAVQEITRWALVGFRYDYYDANSDFLVTRRGRFVPASLAVQTFSPVVGVVLSNNARLLFQYDAIVDTLGRDVRGVPTDLANDQWTVRSQVEF